MSEITLLTKEDQLIQFCNEFGYKPSEPLYYKKLFQEKFSRN